MCNFYVLIGQSVAFSQVLLHSLYLIPTSGIEKRQPALEGRLIENPFEVVGLMNELVTLERKQKNRRKKMKLRSLCSLLPPNEKKESLMPLPFEIHNAIALFGFIRDRTSAFEYCNPSIKIKGNNKL